MKTTLEMPETLYRRLKSHAAQRGVSVRLVVTEAVEATLREQKPKNGKLTGWRAAFGMAPGSAREINRIVEKAFETIEPEDWK